jgi:multisubunit Na+/H+ antiporter MnhB subunit
METTQLAHESCRIVFSCVFHDIFEFIDWRAGFIAVVFWAGAMLVAYLKGDGRELRRKWLAVKKGSVIFFVGLGVLFLATLLIYSPYKRYEAAKTYIVDLEI